MGGAGGASGGSGGTEFEPDNPCYLNGGGGGAGAGWFAYGGQANPEKGHCDSSAQDGGNADKGNKGNGGSSAAYG